MHDIEAQISRISGQQNYMEQLQKITGNIEFVDMDMYHDKHNKLVNCDSNIKKVLRKMLEDTDSIDTIKSLYDKESNTLNLKDNTFGLYVKKSKISKKQKKPREIINNGYRPIDLVKTEWFKIIKRMEKDIHKFLIEVFPDTSQNTNVNDGSNTDSLPNVQLNNKSKLDVESKTFADLEHEYKLHPELLDIKTALDCKINTNKLFTSIIMIKKFAKIIINILLTPMYDVKKTIHSHWSEINRIFKTKAFQQTKLTSPDDIIEILYQFIIAKYRATITGNNKHYVKLFLDTVGNENVSNMDGARFVEIMDAIDLDKLNKKDKVYQFALGAKSIMQRIVNNENITPNILKEFDNMFNDENDEDVNSNENSDATNKTNNDLIQSYNEHADIFN